MDETSSEKIRNYFTDRIEEIKEGTFVPSYDQVKDLPEFSGINRDAFIIARNGWFKQTFHMNPNKWYKQNFHMNFNEFSSYLASGLSEEEYVLKLRRENKKIKRNLGVISFFIGVVCVYMAFMIWGNVPSTVLLKNIYIFLYIFLCIYILILIGPILMVIGIILVLVTSKRDKKRQKKLDSMSQSDLVNMFDCSVSGNKGAVHLIKLEEDHILVKQSCPPNGVRSFRIPLRLKDLCISHFRDTVFRCFKCGQESTVDHVKFSGWWTLIKLSCPTHGNNLPYHKIWSSVFTEISNEGSPIKFAVISQSDLVKMFTCPGCGSTVATFLIKLEKDQILVKQKCPNHLEKVLRIPLRLKDQCVSHFRDAVFRCYKCGQEATVDHVKFSGPWALIKLSCPTHGNKLPYHKIWSSVYSDISNGVDAKP